MKGESVAVTAQEASSTRRKRPGILLIGLAALLPLMGFAGIALVSALGAYRTIDDERLQYTARAVAAAVDAQIGNYITALEMLATSRLLDDPLDVEVFEARARDASERLGGGIVLIDAPPEFQMLANTSRQPGAPLPRAVHPEGEPVLAGVFASGRPGVSDLFTGAVTGQPTLAVMVPVDRPGQSRRVLALAVTPSALRDAAAQQGLPPGTSAAIADAQLRIVAHSFDTGNRLVGVQAPEWIAAAIDGKARTLVVGPGWTGPDNVYAVERLARAPGWAVGVYTRRATQQASAWAALRWLVAGSAVLGLGLAIVVWASRREAVQDARRESEALRTGRAEVERLHARLPAVIFLREVAPDGSSRRVYLAGDVERVTGLTPAEAARRVTIGDRSSLLDQRLAAVLRDGTGSWEWEMTSPDGSRRTMQTQVQVLEHRPGGGTEVVGYVLDVTAERVAEARAMASARMASLGEMAIGLAHEIKQPLQAISLAAEVGQMAARQGDAAEAKRRFEQIVEQTVRASAVIDQLRRFARGAEHGAPQQSVPLAAALEGALELRRSALRDASISCEVDLSDPPPLVLGQEVLLEQVLSNLLLNARDALAARPVGAPRQIRIAAAPGEDGTVRLTVRDTGGGIAPEIMARLFEPFVTTKGPDKGTGLGLSICHGLVKGMGGSIEAHNDAEGAVFTITLQAA